MSQDGADRLAVARSAAETGGAFALDAFRGTLEVAEKTGPNDLVSETDREAQARVVDVIESEFPDEPVVGEEDDARGDVPEDGPAWIVDPIDGTNNFVRGSRFWCTAVAAVRDGEPVAAAVVAPALGDSYAAGETATRNGEPISVSDRETADVATVCPTLTWPDRASDRDTGVGRALEGRFADCRRIGAAQLELALVADGGIDAAIADVRGSPWDTVAGAHLVRAAGGRVTDPRGDRWRHDGDGLVASNGPVHEAARRVVAPESDEPVAGGQ